MQAIQTKTTKPTSQHGTRIKAVCGAGTATVVYDYGLDCEANHVAAAEALRVKLGWLQEKGYGALVTGCLADGTYVHVFA